MHAQPNSICSLAPPPPNNTTITLAAPTECIENGLLIVAMESKCPKVLLFYSFDVTERAAVLKWRKILAETETGLCHS